MLIKSNSIIRTSFEMIDSKVKGNTMWSGHKKVEIQINGITNKLYQIGN